MTDTTTAIARGHETIGTMLDARHNQLPHRLGEDAEAAQYFASRITGLARNPLIAAIDAAGLGHVLTPDEITVILRVTEAFEAAHLPQPQMMP